MIFFTQETGNRHITGLHKTSNFPEFTSRVCPALCEKACTCGLNGKAVCTKENEMAIIEHAYAKGYAKVQILLR